MVPKKLFKGFVKKRSIITQWVFFVGIIVIAMISFNLIYYRQVASVLEEEIYTNADVLIEQFENNINSEYENVSRIIEAAAFNSVTQSYLIETEVAKQFEVLMNFRVFLESMQGMRDDITNIMLVGQNGRTYSLATDPDLESGFISRIPSRSAPIFSYIAKDKDGMSYFYVGMRVYSIDIKKLTNQDIGTIVLKIDAVSFLNLNRDEMKESGWNLFFLDDKSNLVESTATRLTEYKKSDLISAIKEMPNDSPYTSNIILDDESYYIRTYPAPIINGRIISMIPEESLSKKVRKVERQQYIIMFFTVLVLCFPFLVIMRNFLKPMKDLVFLMESISAGNRTMLKQRLPQRGGSTEIDILTDSFNNMMDEVNALTDNLSASYSSIYEMKLENKRSELAHLRSQINPHFLYNTLESIKGIAVEENVPRITMITTALGNMFRYSIKGSDIVPLKEEVSIIESYVRIQKIRFEDRFDVTYEFDKKILGWQISKMLLQPLVENAIYHGLEKAVSKGHLYVGGTIENDVHMLLWVQDDGEGMSREKLESIQASLASRKDNEVEVNTKKTNGSIGLNNVNNRIRLMYGEEYGVQIDSSKEKGTRVEIRLPKDLGG